MIANEKIFLVIYYEHFEKKKEKKEQKLERKITKKRCQGFFGNFQISFFQIFIMKIFVTNKKTTYPRI